MPSLLITLGAMLVTPCFFTSTGLLIAAAFPRFLRGQTNALPLVGVGFWGVVGLARLMTGLPCGPSYALVGIVAFVVMLARRAVLREIYASWRECRKRWWMIYGFFLVVLAVSPFPGLWLMGGDWWEHFRMILAAHSNIFGASDLARSPYYAVAAWPLIDAGGGLAAFQIFGAVAAAAAWLPIVDEGLAVDAADLRLVRWGAIVAVGLAPFVTVTLQNLWPKFFAGGFLWLALKALRECRRTGTLEIPWASGLWFAAAVLAHEATLLCLPIWVVAALGASAPDAAGSVPGAQPAGRSPRRKAIAILVGPLVVAALCILIWEGWTLLRFGWEARVAANPAVTFDQGLPWMEKMFSNLKGLVISELPGDLHELWRGGLGHRWPPKLYYTVIAIMSWMGATAVGIAWPWLLGAPKAVIAMSGRAFRTVRGRAYLAAIIAVIVLNSLVLGSAPRYGAVQTGFVPLAMWLIGMGWGRLRREDGPGILRVLGLSLVFGWLPYAAIGGSVAALLIWPGRLERWVAQLRHSDGDLVQIMGEGFHPLGLQPLFWGLAVAGAVFIGWQASWLWKQAKGAGPQLIEKR